MRRCTRLFVPTLLAAACATTGSAAEPGAPALVGQVADGTTLVADWQKSLYGKMWNDQALADVRADTTTELAKVQDELGFDPLAALAAMKGASMVLTAITQNADGKPLPHMQLGADVGDFAARIVKLIESKSDKGVPAKVAGADEALTFADPDSGNVITIARFASRLSIGINDAPAAANPVAGAPRGDASFDVDLQAFIAAVIAAMPAEKAAEFKQQIAGNAMLQEGGTMKYQAAMVPEGVHEGMEFATTVKTATRAVDRELLARLPATALLTLAMGIDGKGLWAQNGKVWMAQAAQASNKQSGEELSPEDMEKRLNAQLTQMGFTFTIAGLVSSIDSTAVLSLCQGTPYPTATIALPRSAEIDQLIAFALKQVGATPPAEGQSTILPLPLPPPVPAINLICDAKAWVITSDNDIAVSWTGGKPGGWADSAAGKDALAAADAAEAKGGGKAYLIGSSDTANVLRAASGYLSIYLASLKDMDPKEKQDAITGLGRLAAIASPGHLVATSSDKGLDLDSRGLFGFIGIPVAVGAVAAIKNAGGGAAAANEAAAIATLKGPIFKGETEFQQKGYVDQDGNGIGEYGLLSELGGARPVAKELTAPLVDGALTLGHDHGYNFVVFVPDAKGGAVGEPEGTDKRASAPAAAPMQEKHFVAYAWPEDDKAGKNVYAITEAGEVRQAMYLSSPPAWGDLFDGNGWDSQAQWAPVKTK